MNASHIRYRPHIDGLRAIAVVGVVLFHFGAGWLPGGFVGVDVFFVISGFLISRSLYEDVEKGKFSVADFYERRARRILPALLVVIALTGVVAYFLLFPKPFVQFARSAIASLTFTGNFYFWIEANYFAPDASQIPLLHLWSLGIEEQFYIFFPLLMMALVKLPGRAVMATLVGLAVLSLAMSQIMLSVSPHASFYLLPFRAFELLIGCVLARREMPSSLRVSSAVTTAGVLGIVATMLLIDEHMAFPGLLALAPCMSAGLMIWGAEQRPGRVAVLLGSACFRFLGAISYSLYLVHWPVLVFCQAYFRPLLGGPLFLVAGFLVCVALAWLSYRIVEQPFRQNREFWTRRRLFGASFSASAFVLALAVAVIAMRGIPSRISDEAAEMLAWRDYKVEQVYRTGECFLGERDTPDLFEKSACLPERGEKSIVIWGDSAMAHYYSGLKDRFSGSGSFLGQATASGCPPIANFDSNGRPLCRSFNDMVLPLLLEIRPSVVILGARWDAYDNFEKRLLSTIGSLRGAGITVVVLGQPPEFARPVPEILASRIMVGDRDDHSGHEIDFDRLSLVDDRLRSALRDRDGVVLLSILETACPNRSCLLARDEKPLFWDTVHLTAEGSRVFAEALAGSSKLSLSDRFLSSSH